MVAIELIKTHTHACHFKRNLIRNKRAVDDRDSVVFTQISKHVLRLKSLGISVVCLHSSPLCLSYIQSLTVTVVHVSPFLKVHDLNH